MPLVYGNGQVLGRDGALRGHARPGVVRARISAPWRATHPRMRHCATLRDLAPCAESSGSTVPKSVDSQYGCGRCRA